MKKFLLFFGIVLISGVVLVGYSNVEQQSAVKDMTNGTQFEKASTVQNGTKEEILRGTNEVITTIKELKNLTETEADNISEINKLGQEIAKKWDRIEKKVEKAYPQDYKDIEKSLYPLIAMAKSKTPNKENLQVLSIETLDKLAAFKEKL